MKEQEDTLMKSRSARSVVAAAFRLFSGNFRRLFRSTWLAALIYAIINSLLGTAIITNLYVLVIPLFVVGGLAELMFYSVGIDLLGGHSSIGAMPLTTKKLPVKTFWRMLKALLSMIVVEIPFAIVFVAFYILKYREVLASGNQLMTWSAALAIAILIVAVLQLPLAFVCMKYVMRGELKFWKSFVSSYKTGFCHLGHIFMVILINAIILIVAHYVITQPAVILEVANAQSQLGLAMGDPSGMPSYMTPLCLVTFLLAGFIQAYIRMTSIFSLYYMYGAIETSETEKKQFKSNIE